MSLNIIESRDISVIVRGLVVGADEMDNKKKFTKRCLESIRKFLPESQIILSTWDRCNIDGLTYDSVIKGREPEVINMCFSDGTAKQMNVNNQITSTNNGLKLVNRKYTLNIRSDIFLTGTGFVKYFIKYNKNKDSNIFDKKILTLPTYNPRKKAKFLFDPSDWFYFGLTMDVKKLFDIPLMDKNSLKGETINGLHLIKNNFEAEQYIWVTFLSKYENIYFPYYDYFSLEAFKASEESYAKNLILLPANKANIKCLKMPSAGYGAYPWLSQGLYTFNEYKMIYNTYNKNKIFYIKNPVEDLAYFLAYNMRLFVKNYLPGFYKSLVNFIRKINGSYNLLK